MWELSNSRPRFRTPRKNSTRQIPPQPRKKPTEPWLGEPARLAKAPCGFFRLHPCTKDLLRSGRNFAKLSAKSTSEYDRRFVASPDRPFRRFLFLFRQTNQKNVNQRKVHIRAPGRQDKVEDHISAITGGPAMRVHTLHTSLVHRFPNLTAASLAWVLACL